MKGKKAKKNVVASKFIREDGRPKHYFLGEDLLTPSPSPRLPLEFVPHAQSEPSVWVARTC